MSGKCTPSCRVVSLTAKCLASLHANHVPVTVNTFKRKLDYYANDHRIDKDSRKELKRQAMRHWLKSIIALLAIAVAGCGEQDPRLPDGFSIVTDGTNYAYQFRNGFGVVESWRSFPNCQAAIDDCVRVHSPEPKKYKTWRPVTCD